MKVLQKGYIALTTVLIILAVVMATTMTITMLSIGEAQAGFALLQGEDTMQFVKGCAEDAMLKIRGDASLSGSFTITRPEGTCTVTIVSKTGIRWVVQVSNQVTKYKRTVDITFDRNPTGIAIVRWKEV